MADKNDAALNMKIPSKLYDALKEEAKKKHLTMAAFVRLLFYAYFDDGKGEEKNFPV